VSLDAAAEINDSQIMISQPYQLYVERTDEARNMARFYAMTIELNLFGEICLIRRWGRIGAHGQTKVQPFASERDAVAVFLDLLRQKRSRGYRTVASAARYPAFLPEKEKKPNFAVIAMAPGNLSAIALGLSAMTTLATPNMAPVQFDKCTRGHRITCVVDGDTLWIDGTTVVLIVLPISADGHTKSLQL